MWVGVTLAVLVELVPATVKTTSVAVYFFIISNVGGNMPLIVPVLNKMFQGMFSKVQALRCMPFYLFVKGFLCLRVCIFLQIFLFYRYAAVSVPW